MNSPFKVFFLLACILHLSLQVQSQSPKADLNGHHQVEHLEQSNDHTWFNKNYSDYTYDSTSVATLKANNKGYTITVVAGTWCPDTHRELPHFYKVIDDANFQRENIKLIFVDRDLNDKTQISKKLKIKKVPTFIVYKGEKEVGRITEKPKTTIENDLAKIIK